MGQDNDSHLRLSEVKLKSEWLDSPDGLKRLLIAHYEKAKSVLGPSRNSSRLTAVARLMRLVQGIEREYAETRGKIPDSRGLYYSHWIKWVRDNIGNTVDPASARAFLEAQKKSDMGNYKIPWSYFPNIGEGTLAVLRDILEKEHLLEI